MMLTPHFALAEFACKDGSCVPDSLIPNVQALAEQLEILRVHIDRPIVIVSGYRSAAHNKRIKGAARSQHLYAKAADIRVAGYSSPELDRDILELIAAGKLRDGGVGLYSSWVHYDIGKPGRRWRG